MTSTIKGGGRVNLNADTEECLTRLLMSIRKVDGIESSSARKKFVKGLAERYALQSSHAKLNNIGSSSIKNTNVNGITCTLEKGMKLSSSSEQTVSSNKVRIDIVEAVFVTVSSSSTKSSSSSKSSQKKNDKGSVPSVTWKPGDKRKTLVLPSSTSIKELLKVAKSKLNMKKKPIRCFYVDESSKLSEKSSKSKKRKEQDKNHSLVIDLCNDLSGINDGDVVYVTSFEELQSTDSDDKCELGDGLNEYESDNSNIEALKRVKRIYMHRQNYSERYSEKGIYKDVDIQTKCNFCLASSSEHLEPLSYERTQLPISQYRSEILSCIGIAQVLVICGSTGCGKSTQVPQFILEGLNAMKSEEADQAKIIVTQPRRIAAISLAERVSSELLSEVGETVGYSVKLQRRFSSNTRIIYCTVGVFLRKLVAPLNQNQFLSKPTYVILDEVHERDIDTDISLAILRNLLPRFTNLRLILMSATSQSQLFVDYFKCASINANLLIVPGKIFPVEVKWLDDCERMTGNLMKGHNKQEHISSKGIESDGLPKMDKLVLSDRCRSKIDDEFVCNLVKHIVSIRSDEGHILIFLPGAGEIETLFRKMNDQPFMSNSKQFLLLKLYSSLRDHSKVFRDVPKGVRKIILSTNCAETSVTIPGITNVIDLGRVKECRFDPSRRLSELVPVWVSQASAIQRCGRAGRTQSGVCWRLYKENTFNNHFIAHSTPEIVITSLEEVLLYACLVEEYGLLLGKAGSSMTALDLLQSLPESPSKEKIEKACLHLFVIGALDGHAKPKLTPLGWHLAHLPMDVSLGKMVLVSILLGCLEPILVIASALSCTKSMFLPHKLSEKCRPAHEKMIRDGYGGADWKNGTVKGDLIAIVASYSAWEGIKCLKEQRQFARINFLDCDVLYEITRLRSQIKGSLTQAGFLVDKKAIDHATVNNDNVFLVSCCIVAGLYPNIATLVRNVPGTKKSFPKLLTKDGDLCLPSSSSFQRERIISAKSEGRDVYATYLSKFCIIHSSNGDGRSQKTTSLTDINFVSRFAIVLFGGNLDMKGNIIIFDEWLKFKLDGDCSKYAAFLIHALREELDNILIDQINSNEDQSCISKEQTMHVIKLVDRLITEE